ncbi:MAG TPA: ester cyclase [Herpetosiphonaceae bacterium]
MMSAEENKAKVRRYFEEALTNGDVSFIDDMVDPEEIVHGYDTDLDDGGPEETKQFVAAMRATFHNLRCTVDQQIAEGDLVMTRWTARGIHQDEHLGIPGTGQPVTVSGIMIHRFRDGKSVETWGEWDRLGLMKQLDDTSKSSEINA